METVYETQYIARFAFIEILSAESIAMTGHGIYVYLTPIDIEQLFNHYQKANTSSRDFARQCIKKALGH